MRSNPGWVTETISAFARCFLSSMQKASASLGACLSAAVRFILQFCACAHISSLTVPAAVYIISVSSSLHG